jgi:hypothetical protein
MKIFSVNGFFCPASKEIPDAPVFHGLHPRAAVKGPIFLPAAPGSVAFSLPGAAGLPGRFQKKNRETRAPLENCIASALISI